MDEKKYIDRHSIMKKVHTGMNVIEAMQAIIDEPAADVVEVVRCKNCKHRPYPNPNSTPTGAAIGWDCYSDDEVCPYVCDDPAYTTIPEDNSFCDRGERR